MKVLYSAPTIQQHTADTARKLCTAWAETHRYGIELIVVMDGAMPYAAALLTAINRLGVTARYATVSASSYKGTRQSTLELECKAIGSLKSDFLHVIVDDILDTGKTMEAILQKYRTKFPDHVLHLAPLLHRTAVGSLLLPLELAYEVKLGKTVLHKPLPVRDDAFVVGYGLDHNGDFRDIPHICELPKELQ